MTSLFKAKIRHRINRTISCSFCRKDKDQVTKLIAGPGVYICNECVDLCTEILAHDAKGRDS